MSAGVAQVMTGVALVTLIATDLLAVVKLAPSVGVKVTESDCAAPAESTVRGRRRVDERAGDAWPSRSAASRSSAVP